MLAQRPVTLACAQFPPFTDQGGVAVKNLRILVVVTAMVFGIQCTSESLAQSRESPEAIQAGKDLIALMSREMVADLTTNMAAQVWPAMESSLRTQNPNIDAAALAELRKEFERLVASNITEIMSDAPATYARYLTVQEMRDIIAFYKTPSGSKALKLMPQITADIMAAFPPRMQELQAKVNIAFLTILKRRGYNAQ